VPCQLERAWARWLVPTHGKDSVDVLVCHGNVDPLSRHPLDRLDPKLWLNFSIHNGGITIFEARPDGRVRLVAYNDTGHLPKDLITPPLRGFTPPAPATSTSPR